MNTFKTCQHCGETFYAVEHWKTLCIPCFKKSKQRENNSLSELAELRLENSRLRFELAIRHQTLGAIPSGILKTLIRLAHPDKHGNSTAANDATAWLLTQRGQA